MPTILRAPMRGWLSSLHEVPDEVFAQRLLGDGVCIDPTGDALHAPCDALVISLPDSIHAIALRSDDGVELLLHIGIDTVALKGAGFHAHVAVGDRVRVGQPLISFDLSHVAVQAKSLITPIVITNGEAFELLDVSIDREIEVGDELCSLRPRSALAKAPAQPGAQEITRRVVVTLEHGIHARPAASLAQSAKTFDAEVHLRRNSRNANARSPVALLSLGLKRGDEVTLAASGREAQQAIESIAKQIAQPSQHEPVTTSLSEGRIRGVIASRGLAVGRCVLLLEKEIKVQEEGSGAVHEAAEFERARGDVRARLERMASAANVTAKEVIAAHLEFLDDWELVAAARRAISQGKSAAFAWRRAVRDSADTLRALGDQRLAERIDDLLDLESQVIQALVGEAPPTAPALPDRAIVVCNDLKPSQFVALEASRLAGICMATGGPTSHVAILAGALGIPMLVAAGRSILDIAEGEWLVLDAENGTLHVAADADAISAAEQTVSMRQQRKHIERAAAQAECRTADGERVEVFANLGSLREVRAAVANGAEGCGLLRTEFLFLDRSSAPTEEEQRDEYQAIANALDARPLIIRTLDIGGDKAIPYLPLPSEANPALGLRGIRTSLWRPDLLRTQLRAILAVQPFGQARVLLPMITDVSELRAIRRIVAEICRELGRDQAVTIGVMIETPAAAISAEQLALECDFVSIGTNDLTQYTLAMDRTHTELAHRIDGLHPAVLRLIELAALGARRHNRLVAVCGGLASDPAAVPILIGLGVRELSVVPAAIAQIKAIVSEVTIESAAALARSALQLESPEAVRTLLLKHAHTAKVTP